MKTVALTAVSILAAISMVAQVATQQKDQTVQMQCRQLIKGQNDFISSDETWVNGMASYLCGYNGTPSSIQMSR